MAWALIEDLLRHGVAASQLRLGEPVEKQRARLPAESRGLAVADNAVEVRDATMVALFVTPQRLLSVLADLCPAFGSHRPLLPPIAAGRHIAERAACCPEQLILRARSPNESVRPSGLQSGCGARPTLIS